MLVRVLGPVEVSESGALVPLPGAIPTRILALLTTNLTAGVRTDFLIEGVWGEGATPAAHATLQSHVARLRRAVGANRVATTAHGYRLALPPSAVDAQQFVTSAGRGAALLAKARPADAARVLGEALRLWRGEAYDGLDDCEPLAHERARLARLRLDTTLRRIESDLTADPSGVVVAEVEALLQKNPTNEQLWALLMRAWVSVGDTATALAVFGRARKVLRDEWGLEPGPQLRDVQAAILRADVTGAVAVPVRRTERRVVSVVAVSEPLTDDDPEGARARNVALRATVSDVVTQLDGVLVPTPGAVTLAVFGAVTAREDDPGRALLCGRRIAQATGARIGVSTGLALITPELDQLGAVADRAVAQAMLAAPGEVAVVGEAPERSTRPMPPVPFVGRSAELDRLKASVHTAARRGRAVVLPVIGEAGIGKSRLLAEVRHHFRDIDWFQAQCDSLGERGGFDPVVDALRERAGGAAPAASSRSETIAAWCAALAALAGNGPVVFCVEDAHWASEVLLDLIDDFASGPVLAPLVLVVTARPEIELRRPSWLVTCAPVRLTALGDVDTTMLVNAVLDQTSTGDADRVALAAACGGVPLFAVELGRALTTDAGQQIPHRLSDLMAARIDSLAPAARDVLTDAAVVGSTFWSEAIGAAPAAIEALLQREFIQAVRPGAMPEMHEYRFRHDLLRDAAYGRLLRADRAAEHLAVARWWQSLGRGPDAAITAEHAWLAHELFVAAGVPDQAEELALAASRSAAAAVRGLDTAAAVTFLQRSAALQAGQPSEAAALIDLAEALSENRLLNEADQVVRRAQALVDPADGLTRLSAAVLALQLDFALGRPYESETLAQLLADFPVGPIHVGALGVLAVHLVIGQTPESFARAIEVSDTAIAMARDLGDEDVALLSFSTRGRARLALGDERGLADMDRSQQRGPGVLPPYVVLGTRQWYAGAAHHWSGPAAELRIREELEDYARRTGLEFLVSFGVAERLRCLWELGRAEECVAEADRIDRRSEAMTRWVVVQRALALADIGRLDEAAVADVLGTPPADDTDLRHVIGVAAVHARHALDQGNPLVAASVLTDLGDLTAYAARDGAAEFLPRVLRLAAEAGLDGFGAGLSDVIFEQTPLGRALTASVRGLVRRDQTLLRAAVRAWESLGDSVDLQLARADVEEAAKRGEAAV